jgi:hypothetical protein
MDVRVPADSVVAMRQLERSSESAVLALLRDRPRFGWS